MRSHPACMRSPTACMLRRAECMLRHSACMLRRCACMLCRSACMLRRCACMLRRIECTKSRGEYAGWGVARRVQHPRLADHLARVEPARLPRDVDHRIRGRRAAVTTALRARSAATRTTGLEPATFGSTVRCSNQLSYVPENGVRPLRQGRGHARAAKTNSLLAGRAGAAGS